jgi:hypothetical protein
MHLNSSLTLWIGLTGHLEQLAANVASGNASTAQIVQKLTAIEFATGKIEAIKPGSRKSSSRQSIPPVEDFLHLHNRIAAES